MLKISKLTKRYGAGDPVLKELDLTVEGDQLTSVIGSSGAGKSTLLRCINRLVEPTSGSVELNGTEFTTLGRRDLRAARRRIGMVFQGFNLIDRLTVMENVQSGRLGYISTWAALTRRYPREDIRHAYELMERVGIAHYADKRADELSGGERQTVAIARAQEIVDMSEVGRSQGRLFVVGIGPGQEAWRSPEVTRMVQEASDLVGYSLYLDIIDPISQGKTRHDFDLGKEEDRVRHSMELAGEGKDVALVCSGDAGIYAMATLVFELLADGGLSDAASRIAIEVSPGISALQAAAARAGAPLGHDFCTISLSDLLTPWDAIKMRVKAAAEGDFVIAFYNPVSKRRRTQLEYAKGVLLDHRPENTPVILATNLGREGEQVRIVPLAELDINDVDMLTVVIVGSSETTTVDTGDGKTWVYTPRGYSAKEGTGIKS